MQTTDAPSSGAHASHETRTAEKTRDLYREMDFNCDYSDNLPALLKTMNISLAFTSYQAGRLMLVRTDGESLDINFKSFPRPMGLTASDQEITLGAFTEIINFKREDGLLEKIKQPLHKIEEDITAPRIKPKETAETDLAETADGIEPALSPEQRQQRKEAIRKQREYLEKLYEPVDKRVDGCYIARSSHHSGMINIHDIEWGSEGLWAVNSSFSCLCTVEPDYSFVPRWKPHFISELAPEDRCHLNGMTLRDGKPAYVTTFSSCNTAGLWRKGEGFNGTLMDVQSNEILLEGLAMPHSPRWYREHVYFCNSGHGSICRYDPLRAGMETLAEVPGFTRGMDFHGPILFVGLSKIRESDVTRPAPLRQKISETESGIWLINLEDHSTIGQIRFTGNVDQIYDVAVIPNSSFPELIEPSHPRMRNHFCHPEIREIVY